MALNLVKDGKYVFNRRVSEVHLYEGGNLAGSAGYLGKSAVAIKAVPRTTDLIDGSKYQLGYDVTYEITSEQLYSVFEFEKLMNKSGFIHLPDIPLWIGTTTGGLINFNIEVDINPGETKGQVKISGSKYVAKLTDCLAQNWNGAVAAPFATTEKVTEGTPLGLDEFEYEYILDLKNPMVQFITPASPEDEDDDITEFKLALLGAKEGSMEQRADPPSEIVVKKFDGLVWQPVVADDYDVVFEGGYYYIHYQSATASKLGDKFKVTFAV
jgi:hypothetical protein